MSTLDRTVQLRDAARTEVYKAERKIEELEAQYLAAESSQLGNVLKGLDGFLSGKENRRSRQAKVVTPDEFLFSLSSMTSEVWNKLQPNPDIQDGDYAPMGTGKRYAQKGYAQKGYKAPGKMRRLA
eukprot:jgi/Ulvmu1/7866/UM004_0097.1